MSESASADQFSRAQVERAISVIDTLLPASGPSKLEELSYKALQMLMVGYVLCLLLFLGLASLVGFELDGAWGKTLAWLLLMFVGFSVAALALLVLNLAQAREFRRRLRMLGHFGLLRALDDPWQEAHRKHRLGNFASALLLLCGSGIVGLSLLMILGAGVVAAVSEVTVMQLLPTTLGAFTLMMVGAVPVGYHFLRRARVRYKLIDKADSLKRLLLGQIETSEASGEDEAPVYLEKAWRDQFAAIERASIRSSRAEAVESSLGSKDRSGFSALKSLELQSAQIGLLAPDVLAIERTIREVLATIEAAPALDSERVDVIVPVEGAPRLSLLYQVDPDHRTVRFKRLITDVAAENG